MFVFIYPFICNGRVLVIQPGIVIVLLHFVFVHVFNPVFSALVARFWNVLEWIVL